MRFLLFWLALIRWRSLFWLFKLLLFNFHLNRTTLFWWRWSCSFRSLHPFIFFLRFKIFFLWWRFSVKWWIFVCNVSCFLVSRWFWLLLLILWNWVWGKMLFIFALLLMSWHLFLLLLSLMLFLRLLIALHSSWLLFGLF